MERHKVTCLKCKQSDNVMIVRNPITGGRIISFEAGAATPFLSGRYRADGQYGFECSCGADTRLCKEEAKDFDKLVYGSPMGIEKLRKTLQRGTKQWFRMEAY